MQAGLRARQYRSTVHTGDTVRLEYMKAARLTGSNNLHSIKPIHSHFSVPLMYAVATSNRLRSNRPNLKVAIQSPLDIPYLCSLLRGIQPHDQFD
jgi:hypothetical protein